MKVKQEEFFEITTTLAIEDKTKNAPTKITSEDLAKAFLNEKDLNHCYEEIYVVKIEGRKLSLGVKLAQMLLGKIDVQFIADGTVAFKPSQSFQFSVAKKKILKRFGLSKLHYDGTKNKVKGLVFSSKITTNPDDHRNKFVELYKSFKTVFPNLRLKPTSCLTTNACSLEDKKFLSKLTKQTKIEEVSG